MKHLIDDINKAFESRVRLGIMSLLMVNDAVDFITLKQELSLTDGNLASHLTALEKLEYIKVAKQFVGKKPNTTYSASKSGKKEFLNHINALERFIKKSG